MVQDGGFPLLKTVVVIICEPKNFCKRELPHNTKKICDHPCKVDVRALCVSMVQVLVGDDPLSSHSYL